MIALLGGILTLVGIVWIAIIAFQNGDTVWGVVSILCGLAAIIYGVQHFDEAKVPLGLLVVGMVIGGIGRGMALSQGTY